MVLDNPSDSMSIAAPAPSIELVIEPTLLDDDNDGDDGDDGDDPNLLL